ncbi:TPA: hypothetical protein HA251_03170 [Candidatus Woesearchaeota archaeon]|nr:hypothetical protein [Candidatus Woesearchaeota archaeon]
MHPLRLKDGTTIASRDELYAALGAMTNKTFSTHCDEKKNDFASWIEHELSDKFLAASMRRATNKEEMRKALFVAMFR